MAQLYSPYVLFTIIAFCSNLINCATFENVKGVLTENAPYLADYFGPQPKAGTKPFAIESDDTLVPYVKDEDELTIIKITDQNIPKLPKDSIKDLTKITELIIVNSHLKEIEPGAINNNPKLRTYSFDDNELEIIKNGVFTGLKLLHLSLNNNKIKTIENEAFKGSEISQISLNHNQISTWNSEWFKDMPVDNLFFGNNLLTEIPSKAFQLGKSTYGQGAGLYFENNKIKIIQPDALHSLKTIQTLSLKDNEIEILSPGMFDDVEEITSLYLENNKLAKIDKEVFKNAKLFTITLNNNKLTEFPIELIKSTQVTYLHLKNNPLRCKWIEEVDNWLQNKTGEYFGEGYPWMGFEKGEQTKNCVQD